MFKNSAHSCRTELILSAFSATSRDADAAFRRSSCGMLRTWFLSLAMKSARRASLRGLRSVSITESFLIVTPGIRKLGHGVDDMPTYIRCQCRGSTECEIVSRRVQPLLPHVGPSLALHLPTQRWALHVSKFLMHYARGVEAEESAQL